MSLIQEEQDSVFGHIVVIAVTVVIPVVVVLACRLIRGDVHALIVEVNAHSVTVNKQGEFISLGSPTWVWGKFYEFVIRSILQGGWKREKGDSTALNYWLGMDSGVIGVEYSNRLPAGLRQLAKILEDGLKNGTLDPFMRRIVAQDGTVKNDGNVGFSPEELLQQYENRLILLVLPEDREFVREQIRSQLAWLSGRAMDAICDGAPDLYMLVKKDETGLSVGLWNFSVDEVDAPTVHLGADWDALTVPKGAAVLNGRTVTLEPLPAFGCAFFTLHKKM